MSKEKIKKLKQKIAAILGIGILGAGGVTINVNIQTEQFYEQLADGKLYVNAFNQKAYKEVRSALIKQVDDKSIGRMGKDIYWQMMNKVRPKDGWLLHNVNQDNVKAKLHEAFKLKINE